MTQRERGFEDAERVIDESVVMRVVAAVVEFVGRVFQARRLPARTAALKGPPYIVAAAAAAILTHALLLQLMPERIAPVKPMAYWMVVAFAAFCVVSVFITTRSSATATADNSAGTANTRKS